MNELLKNKLKEILDNKRTVTSLAKELGVSRHTVYKYLSRYKRLELNQGNSFKEKRNNTAHNKIPSEVESLVITYAKRYPNDSVLVISKKLQKESHIVINPVTVFRILKRNNIRYSLSSEEIIKEKLIIKTPKKVVTKIKNIELIEKEKVVDTKNNLVISSLTNRFLRIVTPAKAGVQVKTLDSRLRGNDTGKKLIFPILKQYTPALITAVILFSLIHNENVNPLLSSKNLYSPTQGLTGISNLKLNNPSLEFPKGGILLVGKDLNISSLNFPKLRVNFIRKTLVEFNNKVFTLATGSTWINTNISHFAILDTPFVTPIGQVLGTSTQATLLNKKDISFIDKLSLNLFCKVGVLRQNVDISRCNTASKVIPSTIATTNTPVITTVNSGTTSLAISNLDSRLHGNDTGKTSSKPPSNTPTYITEYITKYITLEGKAGPAGKDGISGKDGLNGKDSSQSQGGFGGYVTPVNNYFPPTPSASLIGVSTISYLRDTTLDYAKLNYGTSTNQYIQNATVSNGVFNGGNLFNDQVSFTGNVTINNLTSSTTNLTSATSTNHYITNLSALDSLFTNSTTTNAVITNLTNNVLTTNSLTAVNATSTNHYITNLSALDSLFTNSTTTNSSIASLITTNATSTNFFSTNSFLTNGTSTNHYITNLEAVNSLFTNSTTTNSFATNSTTTNANITNLTNNVLTTNSLTATNGTTTNFFTTNLAVGTVNTTGNQTINGTLNVNGTTLIGSNTTIQGSVTLGTSTSNFITVNGLFNSNITPAANISYDLGTPSLYWRNVYAGTVTANSFSAASTSISGTNSTSFSINSSNASTDTQDSSLVFFRGIVTPNAILRWNSLTKRLESNMSLHIENETPATGTTTFSVQGGQGQGAVNLVELRNNSGTLLTSFNSNGGLSVNENINASGTLNVSGTSTLATTTITGLLTVNSNTNITQGGILTVGDKVIAPGEIGAGTSSPSGKISIQSTNADQVAFLIYGSTTQTSPLISIFDYPGSNQNIFQVSATGTLTTKDIFGTSGNFSSTLNVLGQTTLTNASSTNLSVSGILYAPTLSSSNVLFTNATSTNLFTSILNAVTGTINNLTGGSITATSSLTSNGTLNVTGLTTLGNASTTNLSAVGATLTNLFSTNATITNASTTNLSATGATFTNTNTTGTATILNASTTNLSASGFFSTNAFVTGFTATNASTTNLSAVGATLASLFSTNATLTNASTTNLSASGATLTNLYSTSATLASATSTNFFTSNLSSTNSTLTNSTSTNLYSTSASFGVLSASSAVIAGAITGATSFNGLVITPNTGVVTTGTWNASQIANAYIATGLDVTKLTVGTTLPSNVLTSSLTTVGALASGSIASGFGTISTANTITGTTLNGTTGINTGATGGTQRIDASGNLVNIGTISSGAITSGLINGQTISSAANFTGSVAIATTLGVTGQTTLANASSTGLTVTGGTYLATTGGNVGIGTTAPVNLLQISNASSQNDTYGNVQTNYTGTVSSANSGYTAKNYQGTSQFMQWDVYGLRVGSRIVTNTGQGNVYLTYGNDNIGMTMLGANGNVGIGDTTPTNKLDVTGAIGISDVTVIDASRNLTNIGTISSGAITSGLINGQTISSAANFTGSLTAVGNINLNDNLSVGKLAIGSFGSYLGRQSSDGSTVLQTGQAHLLLNPTGGNVGIGTTSPQTTLAIQGADNSSFGQLNIQSTGSDARISLFNANGASVTGRGDILMSKTVGYEGMRFMINNVDKMILDEGGNVGIGITAPSGKLQVVGDTYFGSSSGTVGNLYLYGSTAGAVSTIATSNGNLHIDAYTGAYGTYLNYFRGTGGIYFGNGATGSNANVSAGGAYTGTSLNVGAGAITSGLINGQTISSAANFTGTVTTAGNIISGGQISLPAANDGRKGLWMWGPGDANWAIYMGQPTVGLNPAGTTMTAGHFSNTHSIRIRSGSGFSVERYSDNALTMDSDAAGNLWALGAISAGSTITGTTLNGTTGINTGAGAGTQRIDASGNLANIGTISSGAITSGLINGQTISSAANFTGTMAVAGNTVIGGGVSDRRLDVHAGNDGLTMGQDIDNTFTIQSYIDNQWAARTTYASGCCNLLKINPDVGSVQIGSATNPTPGLNVYGVTTLNGALSMGSNAITSGLINGQTISSAANFTGTMAVAGALNVNGATNPGNFGVLGGATQVTTLATARSLAVTSIQTLNSSGWLLTTFMSGGNPSMQVVDQAGTSAGNFNLMPYGGNVGIGTTTPTSQLQVKGADMVISDGSGGTYTGGGTGCPWCGSPWTSYSPTTGAGVGDGTNSGGRASGNFVGGYGNWVAGGGVGVYAQGGAGALHGFGGAGVYAKGGSSGANVGGGAAPAVYADGPLVTTGGLVVGSAYAVNARNANSATYGMTVADGNAYITGSVGIGTINPTNAKLQISGGGLSTQDSTRTFAGTAFNTAIGSADTRTLALNGTTESSMWWNGGGTPQFAIDSTSGGGASFWTNNGSWSERMRITSGGYVGIGMAPSNALDVNGAINVPGGGYYKFNNETAWSIHGRNTDSTSMLGSSLKTTIITGGGASEGFAITGSGFGTSFEARNDGQIYMNGNVGIGTAGPTGDTSKVLDIYGATGSGIFLHDGVGGITVTDGGTLQQGGANTYLYNREVGFMTFGTSNTERVRIDSAGNVGIGVSPGTKLDVNGTTRTVVLGVGNNLGAEYLVDVGGIANTDARMRISPGSGTKGKGSFLEFGGTFGASWGGGDTGTRMFGRIAGLNTGTDAWGTNALQFQTNTGGDAPAYTTAMTIIQNGNVGIGTTAPSSKLTLYDDTAGDTAFLTLRHATNYGANLGVNTNSTGDFFIQTVIAGTATKRLTIQRADGSVGIGTASPGYALDVVGTIQSSGQLISNGTTPGVTIRNSGGAADSKLWFDSSINGNQLIRYVANDANTAAAVYETVTRSGASITAIGFPSGNATFAGCVNYNGGTIGSCLSDERLKKNVTNYTMTGLKEIIALNPVTYQYNGLANTPADDNIRTGLIAQQVQLVAPGLVQTVQQKLNETDATPTELLSVNYGALTFGLINAVKELNTNTNSGLLSASSSIVSLASQLSSNFAQASSSLISLSSEFSSSFSSASSSISSLSNLITFNQNQASTSISSLFTLVNNNQIEVSSTTSNIINLMNTNVATLTTQISNITDRINLTNGKLNTLTLTSLGIVGIGNDGTSLGGELLRVSGRIRATGFDIDSAADIAENFPASEAVDAGTVVAFSTNTVAWDAGGVSSNQQSASSNTNATSTASTTNPPAGEAGSSLPTTSYQMSTVRKALSGYEAVGVVSTNSGIVLGSNTPNGVPVAFSGRIPVKVTTENGEVKRGDYLTVSATMPGYAMKLTGEGRSIGRALSDYEAGKDRVLMLVENGNQKLDLAGHNATTTGMLTLGNIDLNANGVSIINIKSLASANGSWSIDENGRIVGKSLSVDNVKTKEFCVDDVCVTRDQFFNMIQQTNSGTSTPASMASVVTGIVAGTSTTGGAVSNQQSATSTDTTTSASTTVLPSSGTSSSAPSTSQSTASTTTDTTTTAITTDPVTPPTTTPTTTTDTTPIIAPIVDTTTTPVVDPIPTPIDTTVAPTATTPAPEATPTPTTAI